MKRRHFLQLAACATAKTLFASSALAHPTENIALSIDTVSIELARNIVVQALAYNQQIPGPVLRMREGCTTRIALTNRTTHPKQMEWYGLPSSNSRSSHWWVEPGATQILELTPSTSGTRWYRANSLDELTSFQDAPFGFLSISSRNDTASFDQEIFLAVRHWKTFTAEGDPLTVASFNDKLLHASEPVRVRSGQKILFRFLNANTQQETHLHLPGHRFEVIALDGHPVPQRSTVEVLSLGPGERVDAIVEMNSPGRWILGSIDDRERMAGLGICIEYANKSNEPQWSAPRIDWSYAHFAATAPSSSSYTGKMAYVLLEEDRTHTNGRHWVSNGRSYPSLESLLSAPSGGERRRIMNATGQAQSVHLPHHDLSLARVHQISIAGLRKDTIRLSAYDVIDADVIPH
jgi:FtsP/CotA-like multicopper oxidase with cupredoxin domain